MMFIFWIYASFSNVTLGIDLTWAAAILGVIYFIPTLIAAFLNKTNQVAILALNLFLGWTGFWWVIALVWSLVGEKE